MNLEQFVEKYLGKKIDWDGYYGGQCVDLFRQYIDDVLKFPQPKGVGGAKDFWPNYDTDNALKNYYDKIPNTPTAVPSAGDVMLWNEKAGGGWGHVAVFLEGNANTFTSFDQNWPKLDVCTKTTHDYKNVFGWLKPKKFTSLKDTDIDWDDFEGNSHTVGWYVHEWEVEKKNVGRLVKEVADKIKDYERLQRTLAETNQQASTLQTQYKLLLDEKNSLESNVGPLEDKIKELLAEIGIMGERMSGVIKERDEAKVEISKLKKKIKDGLSGYSRWDLFVEICKIRR